MTDTAEIVKLVSTTAAAPQCPRCKYFIPGTGVRPGGKCRITMLTIGKERQDYDEDHSCGADGRWFKPRAESDEPVASEPDVEPEPQPQPKRRTRSLALFAFAMWAAGVLSAFWFLGMLK
jgi:hypothetical protein